MGYSSMPVPPRNPWPKYVGIGCLLIFALLVFGVVLGFYGVRSTVGKLAMEYTSEEPLRLPEVNLPAPGATALENRIRSFGDALERNRPTAPLVLTEDELNVLIQRALGRRSGAGKDLLARVRIVGGRLEAIVSIPLADLGEDLRGRYLNGKARISTGVSRGRLVAHLEDLKVGGHYVPDAVRERISAENLLKDAFDDPETARFLTRLQTVEIGDGKIVLTPKSRPSNGTNR
ncbi:MAG: hypothetical protein IT169_05865 [Bryobacterales bacterium]|nr:hypothetical protein [Bryobacterales bacterium]